MKLNQNLLYHWTTKEKALTIMKTGKLKQRRWSHFLEKEQKFVKGSSWSKDKERWKSDNEICLIIDSSKIVNNKYEINGNRTYLLTMGKLNNDFDPNAYLYESEEPNEVFLEGTVDLKDSLMTIEIFNNELYDYFIKQKAEIKTLSNLNIKNFSITNEIELGY